MTLFVKDSLAGYLQIRQMLERRGFKQLLSCQYYVLWGKNKNAHLLAHSYGGNGRFFIAVSKQFLKGEKVCHE